MSPPIQHTEDPGRRLKTDGARVIYWPPFSIKGDFSGLMADLLVLHGKAIWMVGCNRCSRWASPASSTPPCENALDLWARGGLNHRTHTVQNKQPFTVTFTCPLWTITVFDETNMHDFGMWKSKTSKSQSGVNQSSCAGSWTFIKSFFFTCAFSLALCEQNVLHNYYTVSNLFHTFMTVRDVDMLQPITFLTHQKAFNTSQKINNHYEYWNTSLKICQLFKT